MKSRKKIKAPKAPLGKKSRPRRAANNRATETVTLSHRAVEQQFIGEHPEAFDPYVGQWVVLEGTTIVAHGQDAPIVADEARARGVRIPYIFRVFPKRKPNVGYL